MSKHTDRKTRARQPPNPPKDKKAEENYYKYTNPKRKK